MRRLTKTQFYSKLTYAIGQAMLNRSGRMLMGYKTRDAIERAGLPLPPFKNLNRADDELRDNPIFRAVSEFSDPGTMSKNIASGHASHLYPLLLMQAAWEHYKKFPDHTGVIGGARYGIDPRVKI